MNTFKTVLAAGLMLGFASTATASTLDDKLENRIETRLKASKLGDVEVDVENGVATLKGKVRNAAQKARAERLVRLKGISSVENQIELDVAKAKDSIEDRADKQKDLVDKRAEADKDRIDRHAEVAKDRADKNKNLPAAPVATGTAGTTRSERKEYLDPVLTAKVKTKFALDEVVKAHQINVDTDNDGVVTLRGTVGSGLVKARAVDIAKTTDGVRKVNDELKVSPDKK